MGINYGANQFDARSNEDVTPGRGHYAFSEGNKQLLMRKATVQEPSDPRALQSAFDSYYNMLLSPKTCEGQQLLLGPK